MKRLLLVVLAVVFCLVGPPVSRAGADDTKPKKNPAVAGHPPGGVSSLAKPDLTVEVTMFTVFGPLGPGCLRTEGGFTVTNVGLRPAENVKVRFEVRNAKGDPVFTPCGIWPGGSGPGIAVIDRIGPGESVHPSRITTGGQSCTLEYCPGEDVMGGSYRVTVDPDNEIAEMDETNNVKMAFFPTSALKEPRTKPGVHPVTNLPGADGKGGTGTSEMEKRGFQPQPEPPGKVKR